MWTNNKSINSYTDADSSNGDEDITYCLLDSQDWVGSDVIRPDCTVDPTDPSCTDPADMSPDNERLANLYADDVVRNTSNIFYHDPC